MRGPAGHSRCGHPQQAPGPVPLCTRVCGGRPKGGCARAAAPAALQMTLDENKRAVLRSAAVVGMTTAGAAKSQDLVRGLGCKVILVEEAAEVSCLEAAGAAAPLDVHGSHALSSPVWERQRPAQPHALWQPCEAGTCQLTALPCCRCWRRTCWLA